MAETRLMEQSDEELSRCISKCQEKFLNAKDAQEAAVYEGALDRFLSEQRRRTELMLKDETDAVNVELEQRKFDTSNTHWDDEHQYQVEKDEKDRALEERKLDVQSKLKIGEFIVAGVTTIGSIVVAVLGYKGKQIEYKTKQEAWDRICKYEEEGEIPLQQANKFVKM